MRNLLFVSLLVSVLASLECYGQDPVKVRFNHPRMILPLDDALAELRQQYAQVLISNPGAHINYPVTIEWKNTTLEDALGQCLHLLPLKDSIVYRQGSVSVYIYFDSAALCRGFVRNEAGEPIDGVVVKDGRGNAPVFTDANGKFKLNWIPAGVSLSFSGVNIHDTMIVSEGKTYMQVQLRSKVNKLAETVIIGYNGYQPLRPHEIPAAIGKLNTEDLQKNPGPDVFKRMEGRVNGMLTDPNAGNPLNITFHGKSTINGPNLALLVYDKFPFLPDPVLMNPEDVEGVTVLKDAAAASIWGAQSGNGVLVLRQKEGHYATHLQIDAVTAVTISRPPDLFYDQRMGSKDQIAMQQKLYEGGYYDAALTGILALPPVVEILDSVRRLLLGKTDAEARFSKFAQQDVRRDIQKDLYRSRADQTYHLAFSGGGPSCRYYLSGGLDKDLLSLQRNSFTRHSFISSIGLAVLPQRLELTTSLFYTDALTVNDNAGLFPFSSTYLSLKKGSGGSSDFGYPFRSGFTDTAGNGGLLPWVYDPVREKEIGDNKVFTRYFHGQIGITGKITSHLSAEVIQRWTFSQSNTRILSVPGSSYTNDLANHSMQRGPMGLMPMVPGGNILDRFSSGLSALNTRAQLTYTSSNAGGNPPMTILLGAESARQDSATDWVRYYGDNESGLTSAPVDYVHPYTDFITGNPVTLPFGQERRKYGARYVSAYGNASYALRQGLSFYGSFRWDGANLVGVKTNRKIEPFWALGAGWRLLGIKDSLHRTGPLRNLPLLRGLETLNYRLNFGYNGNVTPATANLVIQSIDPNAFRAPQNGIFRSPNPSLTWEKIATLNTGIEFTLKGGRISGSFDYFNKNGMDLYAPNILAPSSGFLSGYGNAASLRGHGFDLVLNAGSDPHRKKPFGWNATLYLTSVKNRVVDYPFQPASIRSYVQGDHPLSGQLLGSLYSYRTTGLDPKDGSPLNYLGKSPADDYASIVQASKDSLPFLINSGPVLPTFYGSLNLDLTLGRLSLSVLLTGKGGHVFRRRSIDYHGFILGIDPGHRDYLNRWQQPGDEKKTTVPSLPAQDDPFRDEFYLHSQSLVTHGDVLRCQTLNLAWELVKCGVLNNGHRLGALLFFTVNNVGILWRANRYGIDPDATLPGSYPKPRTYTLGLRANF